MARRIVVPGLGETEVQPSARRVKGRGFNERERNHVRRDEEDARRSARSLGRAQVREACVDDVAAARAEGSADVQAELERRDAEVDRAKAACAEGREELAKLPRDRRAAERPRVREVCAEVDAARDRGRPRLAAAREKRRDRTDRALAKCAEKRERVPKYVADFFAESRRREEALLAQLRLDPPRRPRTGKQIAAARWQKLAAKASRKRSGKTVRELVDEGAHDVPDQWRWLWKRVGARYVREARSANALATELFEQHLHDHGIDNWDAQSPSASPTYAEEYERVIAGQLSRSEHAQAVEETMEALGLSRAEAEEMVSSWERGQAKAKAKKRSRKAPPRPPPDPEDDGIPF